LELKNNYDKTLRGYSHITSSRGREGVFEIDYKRLWGGGRGWQV